MADPIALIDALNGTMAEAQEIVSALTPIAVQKAQAEYEYRVAKADRIEELRKMGYPASLIVDLAKGERHVADKARARDIARDRYWNRQKELQMRQTEADDLRAQIAREYRAAGWES